MSAWNAMTYEGRDNLLRVVRQQAQGFFELVSSPQVWEQRTACANWQVPSEGHALKRRRISSKNEVSVLRLGADS